MLFVCLCCGLLDDWFRVWCVCGLSMLYVVVVVSCLLCDRCVLYSVCVVLLCGACLLFVV